MASEPLLRVDGLRAGYGDFIAVHDVSLSVDAGETLALIGANGAGKTTLLKAISGLVRIRHGRIHLAGQRIDDRTAERIIAAGIALSPEGRRLFRSLSVEENLILGGQVRRPGPWSLQAVYALFPVLAERRRAPATSLSGGQQQMVAIGRALMANPALLMLDEVSLGLSPLVVQGVYEVLPTIKGHGTAVILVEQDLKRALAAADRFVCMREGAVSLEGTPATFSRARISTAYFGH